MSGRFIISKTMSFGQNKRKWMQVTQSQSDFEPSSDISSGVATTKFVARRAKPGGKVSKAMRAAIRKEISRNAEDKDASVLSLSQNLVSSSGLGFDTQNVIDCGISTAGVQIFQGTGQGQRVGNKIKVKSITFKGTLVPLPYNVTSNIVPRPSQVKIWIFYDKENPTVPPTPQADFFQNGNSVNAFQNDLVDLWLPVNTDKYRVLTTKTFKLGYASYGQAADGVYPSVIGINNNNDFKLNANFSFDLTKHYPKIVDFRDNNGDPSTRGLWAMFAYSCADGTQYSPSQICMNVAYMTSVKYEDV